METILGIAMLYAWTHGIIIISKRIKDTTQFENAVLIAGLVAFVLFVIGSLS